MFGYAVFLVLVVSGVRYSSADVAFAVRNTHPHQIWVGILGNAGKPSPANGGFALNPNEQRTVNSPDNWAGRFWARTFCNPQTKHCQTGDCGNKLECGRSGGVPPATLVEIALRGHGGNDFYDISLVDGYNVKASISPVGGRGQCKTLSCTADINANCPNELRVHGPNGGTIGCKSACTQYHTAEYCCFGAHGSPATCNPRTWRVNSASYFKQNCPDAYSYAYDDRTSTFTCNANSYLITFG